MNMVDARYQEMLKGRKDKLLKIAEEKNLDYILVFGSANVRYFSDFEPLFGDVALIYAASGEQKLLIRFDWEKDRIREPIKQDEIIATYDFPSSFGNIFGKENSRLGVAGCETMSYKLYKSLISIFGEEIVPLDNDVMRLRLIKDEFEIQAVQKAVDITEEALAATFDFVKEGMREKEVGAYFEYMVKKMGASLAFTGMVASGENGRKIVSLPGDKAINRGDTVVFDLGARYKGYCADISRTIAVRKPSKRQIDLYNLLFEIHMETMDYIKPGIFAWEAHAFTQKLYDRHSLGQLKARLGHGIGIETSMEGPDLKYDQYVLEPGMCFCVEISVDYPDTGGIKLEDNLVLTKDKALLMSHPIKELLTR